MTDTPTNLSQALAAFTDTYSPRIIGRVNDYDVKIAHTLGEHVWHVHDHTDEFFLVLDGQFDITLRRHGEGGAEGRDRTKGKGRDRAEGEGRAEGAGRDRGEWTVSLHAGEIFVVPKGIEHMPSSAGGSILMFEPSGTLTTGDRHEGDIPAHVDRTTGRDLEVD